MFRALGFLSLLAFVFAGQAIRLATHAPLPGPVIGLVLFATAFAVISRSKYRHHAVRLEPVAYSLISHMGLLFVPMGVGIVVEWQVIRAEWLPITAGLLGSTLAGLASAGWLTHRGMGFFSRSRYHGES